MISRRNFVERIVQGVGGSLLLPLLPALQSCATPTGYKTTLMGANALLGHRLRTMDFPPVKETIQKDVVIVGGGISGLSAARYLKQHHTDFIVLELGEEIGGNSSAGKNKNSAFPLGAHYLPLPNIHDHELLKFLEECGVITGYENGLPLYNEYYLCFDPKERLFINHYWQDGIIPHEGVPTNDRQEIERFLGMMHDYKSLTGKDGKEAFTIPVNLCSEDPELLQLDSISMETFLKQHKFHSPYLLWYVNYCCADDFGSSIQDTSAWAGIHYYASRKGKAANASDDTVLTWPEGNFWLADQLRKSFSAQCKTQAVVYRVEDKETHIEVSYFDAITQTSTCIQAKQVIMATPHFITRRLLADQSKPTSPNTFEYAPWMVANLTVDAALNEMRGEPLSWDNVIYGSQSLGYVYANHQNIQLTGNKTSKTITYYKPLLGNISEQRKLAYTTAPDVWSAQVIEDLKKPHPAIEKSVREVSIWLWGHGMIQPTPGFITGSGRKLAQHSINDRIHMAHSDLSGISIFEEAFHQGLIAAKKTLLHIIT